MAVGEMREDAIKFLNALVTDNTTKRELDIIKYIKKCVTENVSRETISTFTAQEKEVLEYLNQRAGTRFQMVESNLKFIRARLKTNSVGVLKGVVDKQVNKWKGTDMQMYLRPETLFNATKFESYANGLTAPQQYQGRNYTREELNGLIQSVDEVEI